VVTHARYVIFEIAEPGVSKRLFRAILERIRPGMPFFEQETRLPISRSAIESLKGRRSRRAGIGWKRSGESRAKGEHE
jgi:hypothetical protein